MKSALSNIRGSSASRRNAGLEIGTAFSRRDGQIADIIVDRIERRGSVALTEGVFMDCSGNVDVRRRRAETSAHTLTSWESEGVETGNRGGALRARASEKIPSRDAMAMHRGNARNGSLILLGYAYCN